MDGSSNNKPNGAEIIAQILAAHHVRTVFCLAGTAHTHLLVALEARAIRVVSCRHETNTILAADGYARVSGQVGVALIKNEQGLPNAMTGICTANAACSPVLILSSLAPRGHLESGADYGAAELDMAQGAAKWVRTVPKADRLAEYVAAGLRQAMEGRPGVALLGLPQEFEAQAVEALASVPSHPKASRMRPVDADISALADAVMEAKRPMLLAGFGATLSGAGPVLRRLAERWRLPVLGNSMGRGLVPEDDRLGFSWPLAQVAARDADFVLACGLRFTQRMGYGLPPRFGKEARFAQIDIHAEEIGRNRPVDIALQGDVTATLEALEAELDRRGYAGAGEPDWVLAAMSRRLARIDELGRDMAAETHPYAIGRALEAHLPADAVVVGDGADILNWLHGVYRVKSPRAYMDHYPLGSMGVGTGLALGAAAALRDEAEREGRAEPRKLVLLTGDGAFGFYCGELHSFQHGDFPIMVIVANDGAWGTEHHGQKKALGRSYNCLLGKSDYEKIGMAFGFDGAKIEKPAEVEGAIATALKAGGRTILNILTDTDAGLVRKTDPRVQTVAFEDLASSLKNHYTPDVA